MKKTLLLFTLFFGFLMLAGGFDAQLHAQSKQKKKEEKELKKKWKKIASNYKKNPLALKSKEEGYQKQIESLTQKNNELTERYTELQAELDNMEAQLRRCRQSVDSAKAAYSALEAAYAVLKDQAVKPQEGSIPGLIFRVQIGAYEKFDMSRYAGETGENFSGESMAGLNKYLVGRFRSYNMAQAFRNDIKKLGIRDAWVVAYNDGTRIDIKQALQMEGGGRGTTPTPNSVTPPTDGGNNDSNNF